MMGTVCMIVMHHTVDATQSAVFHGSMLAAGCTSVKHIMNKYVVGLS